MNKLILSILLKVRKMKKTAILIMSLLLAVGVAAQSHSFVDTSYVKYKQFDLEGYLLDTTDSKFLHVLQFASPYTTSSDVVQYNYTNNPDGMKVIGISAVINTADGNHIFPMNPPQYLLLYDALTDNFELKAMIQWEVTDTVGRPYYDWIVGNNNGRVQTWSQVFQVPVPHYYSIFDMFFEEPVTVYDSFYVGGTCTYNTFDNHPGYFSYRLVRFDSTLQSFNHDYRPIFRKFYPYTTQGGTLTPNQWYWEQTNIWMLVFPIIEVVDTSFANAPVCPRVAGLFARGNHTDTVTVQWSPDSLHTEFELSYGHEGIRPEDGTIVTLNNTTRWQFTDTAYSDTPMVAFVRTVCREYDTLRWSGWSSPVYWRLHHEGTNHEGIEVPDDPSDLARFVQLMPNPASNRVLVMSSYGIESMEVYDVRGNRVLEQKGAGRGTTADFDVSAWAKGAYVVLVHTPAGTTAKRLVVN